MLSTLLLPQQKLFRTRSSPAFFSKTPSSGSLPRSHRLVYPDVLVLSPDIAVFLRRVVPYHRFFVLRGITHHGGGPDNGHERLGRIPLNFLRDGQRRQLFYIRQPTLQRHQLP